MANHKSSTSGSATAPGAAGSSLTTPILSGTGTPAGSGTPTSAAVTGIGPAKVIKPVKGFQNTVRQIASGVQKDLPATSTITVAGQQLTQAQILATLQPVLDGFTAISDAENTVKQQRLSLSAILPVAHAFVDNLKVALVAQFGKGSPLLSDFGIKDGSARKKATVATKSAALVKSSETRDLRGTTGKAEKAKLKFTVQVSPASAVKPGGSNGGGNPAGGAA